MSPPRLTILLVYLIFLAVLLGDDPPAGPAEAPDGFVLVSNGLITQEEFDANVLQFKEQAIAGPSRDGREGGLGPSYNATSCFDCHNNPVLGAGSQIVEIRAGHKGPNGFVVPPGGSLVRQRAVDPRAQQRVRVEDEVRTFVLTTSLFGLGYIDFISDGAILAVRDAQPADVRGLAVLVRVTLGVGGPVPDTARARRTKLPRGSVGRWNLRPEPLALVRDLNTGVVRPVGGIGGLVTDVRIGRFGRKCQHGSLADFAADALLNEMGRTSAMQPVEGLAVNGDSLLEFDAAADPEDDSTAEFPLGEDVAAYTRLMRSFRVPPRDRRLARTADAIAGEALFVQCGCAVCHTPTWRTGPAGSVPRGSQPIPPALADKIIHPYSDLLLHNLGTGDGIDQGGGPESEDRIRTALLWGLRARNQFMHDGLSLTVEDAIQRHANQGAAARARYRLLAPADQRRLRDDFLGSL
jgi:CxxC motif-containing protein (DUF1111 family)